MDFEQSPDTWPLRRGETLSNHDWFPFYGHKFLASDFTNQAVLEDRRADIGTAVMLWAESMRQDPAGTLPMSDTTLAGLAKFPSVDAWLAVKDNALHGWVPVMVEDDRFDEPQMRLGHPGLMHDIVSDMYRRKRGRDGAREASKLAVRKSRIRKKMAELRVPEHMVSDNAAVVELALYFEHSDLYITAENVRTAMIEALGYTGDVVRLPSRRSDRDG